MLYLSFDARVIKVIFQEIENAFISEKLKHTLLQKKCVLKCSKKRFMKTYSF